jgi:hypothetical protein
MDLAAVLAAGMDFGTDLATGAGLLILTAVLALDLSATGFISDFFCTGEAVGFADCFVGLAGFTGFTFFTDLFAGVGFTRDADLAAAAVLADLADLAGAMRAAGFADLDGVTRGEGLADLDLGTGLAGVFLAAGLTVFCGLTADIFFLVGVGF